LVIANNAEKTRKKQNQCIIAEIGVYCSAELSHVELENDSPSLATAVSVQVLQQTADNWDLKLVEIKFGSSNSQQ